MTAEPFAVTVARGKAMAEADQRKPPTIYAAFLAMAWAELKAGSNVTEIQWVIKDLTPHLSVTERGVWWYSLKHAIREGAPACGVGPSFDATSEDYDTELTTALQALAGSTPERNRT